MKYYNIDPTTLHIRSFGDIMQRLFSATGPFIQLRSKMLDLFVFVCVCVLYTYEIYTYHVTYLYRWSEVYTLFMLDGHG